MNWLDILILIILSAFTLLGLKRGLIYEAVSIAALVGGIIAGAMFYDLAGSFFIKNGLVENEAIASVGGFIVVALAAYLTVQSLGWILSRVVGTLHLTVFDRIGGGAFGALKGVVLSFLIISALGFFIEDSEPTFKNSLLAPYVNSAFSVLRDAVPEDFREKLNRARELARKNGIEAAVKVKDLKDIKNVIERDKE